MFMEERDCPESYFVVTEFHCQLAAVVDLAIKLSYFVETFILLARLAQYTNFARRYQSYPVQYLSSVLFTLLIHSCGV